MHPPDARPHTPRTLSSALLFSSTISLQHLAWSSLNQQFAHAHAKTKRPEQGHQHSQTTNKIPIRVICKKHQGVGHKPATCSNHRRKNEALWASNSRREKRPIGEHPISAVGIRIAHWSCRRLVRT
jgi:hypothetical protein